jgi:hypothetical protein
MDESALILIFAQKPIMYFQRGCLACFFDANRLRTNQQKVSGGNMKWISAEKETTRIGQQKNESEMIRFAAEIKAREGDNNSRDETNKK